ncbi:MAG: hypothetical protein ACJAXJ_004058 [Colwellia sp.]|jgi:hypothetical protein
MNELFKNVKPKHLLPLLLLGAEIKLLEQDLATDVKFGDILFIGQYNEGEFQLVMLGVAECYPITTDGISSALELAKATADEFIKECLG